MMSNQSKYLFQSQRLGFRNWREEDALPFAKMNSNPEVMAHFPALLTTEESGHFIVRLQKHFEESGFTFFAVDRLEDNRFIGFIGLINTSFEAAFTPCVEIGWRLSNEVWNRGYATEGAQACLNYGFEQLKIPSIYSFTPLTNKASERIMQKSGMRKVGEFSHPKLPEGHALETHVLYQLTEKDWAANLKIG